MNKPKQNLMWNKVDLFLYPSINMIFQLRKIIIFATNLFLLVFMQSKFLSRQLRILIPHTSFSSAHFPEFETNYVLLCKTLFCMNIFLGAAARTIAHARLLHTK